MQIEHRESRNASWTIERNCADRTPHARTSTMKMQPLATQFPFHGRNPVR
jgi:hypothetical protein